ncbi:MAG TPA: ABC transporter substrate-binding protein [Burkholderiales bacterium]|nr:ABC transporter substrate-binding protein [Burkholderiales bacterium]
MLAFALVWPVVVGAQQSHRTPVVGMLITHSPVTDPVVEALRTGLRQLGYEDGRNIRLEARTALGQLDRVPALAEELVRLKVDVIVLANEPALRAVTQATSTIPVVMAGYTDDPAAIGWIESYRRPGGNVTGVFTVNAALISKHLELLKETLPNAARIAVLWDPVFGKRQLEEVQRVAPQLGLQSQPIEVRSLRDIAPAFDTAKRMRASAILVVWTPLLYVHRERVAALGLEMNLPIITDMSNLAEAGALLSYGSFGTASFERAGYYVDRLLKGAKASELPVEQMSNIKLLVNLKTAKALGITIPQSILLRADEVIR